MADPTNLHAIDDIKFLTGYNVEPVVASETGIIAADRARLQRRPSYDEVMAGFEEDEIEFTGDDEEREASPLSRGRGRGGRRGGASRHRDPPQRHQAAAPAGAPKGASDIHIEPYEKKLRVRYRIDGVLLEEMTPPLKLKNAIASRLKIMSQLDIAERRLPQDGRIKLKMGKGREIDFRVSVLPTLCGEKIVLRLLDKGNLQLDMTKLGFEPRSRSRTSSGRSTSPTAWSWSPARPARARRPRSTRRSASSTRSARTSAPPRTRSSTTSHGINQVQMHDEIGLNFAMALRAFLRQDPDIIMVGEIRDFETAEIAVKAALTGHLVLSTLHTNDAPATISRLLNMGVEPFLITASRQPRPRPAPRAQDLRDCKRPLPGRRGRR